MIQFDERAYSSDGLKKLPPWVRFSVFFWCKTNLAGAKGKGAMELGASK